MRTEKITITINDVDFDADVEFTPATYVPAIVHLAPEDCRPDESEDIAIHSLYIRTKVWGMETVQDISFLIDALSDDIKEQLEDE